LKKIIIIVLSFILLLGISYFTFFFNHSKSEEVLDNKEVEINNVNEESQIPESLEENDKLEEEIILDTKEEENKSNNKESKEESIKESVDTKNDTVTNNVPKVDDKKETTKKEEPKEEVIVDKVEKEEVKELTAWEELGITEHDYYNKPMWSWARIDFSIKDYKTYEKTREACIAKGEEYFDQGLGYSCTGINSYSGDYLGEMLKTF